MEQQAKAPPEARAIVNFLRNKSGIKTRVGVLNGKRVDYFKGRAAVKALLSPAYAKTKGVPPVADEAAAERTLHGIIPFAFFLRVDRGGSSGGKDSPKLLQVNQMQMFKGDLHYAWFFEGSQLALKAGGLAMVALMLAGVMFPLWPPTMRLGVWYLSIGVLGLIGLFFAIAVVRLIFWCISLVALPPGVWIFPNLFEDVGFVDSFIPFWAWDVPPPKKGKKGKKGSKAAEAIGDTASSTGKQQAVANLPGAPQRAQAPSAPPAAAESVPAPASSPTPKAAAGQETSKAPTPAAAAGLDDLN